jgi:eukaryotic-like serine/threonine-protein kinase
VEEHTVFQPSVFGSVRPGARLSGIFEIEKFIMQGGMGEVYRGFNIQTGDPVAIKMIRPDLTSNPDVFELFKREARTLHHLAHEAIVRYFVFTVDPDIGRAYLAMEFVDGPSLTKRLDSGPLPLPDVRILQTRIGYALEAAHRLGIIHRDISPDNIILPDGDVRNAKVIDFGIARALQRTEVTIIGGGFAGQYNYASPEQFGLAGDEVTSKSDIYSFGLVLAAALRGRPIDMSGSEVQAIAKRSVVPDLSDINQEIRPLIRAMLQPLPADRPASMAAIAAWAPGDTTSTVDRRGEAPPSRESASGRAAAVLAALIALGSVGGAAYTFRDELAQWAWGWTAPTAPAGSAKLPPVAAPPLSAQIPPLAPAPVPDSAPPVTPPETASPAPTPPSEAPTVAQPPPDKEATPPQAPHVPTPDELAEDAAPRAPQPTVELPRGTVGAPYRADLPTFADPGGKGLRLAANGLPEGMAFNDLGKGRGQIEGAPTRAGSATMQIVATNHNGRSAKMSAMVDIRNKTDQPAVQDKTPESTPPVETALAPRVPQTGLPPQAPQLPPQAPQSTQAGAEARLEPPRRSVDEFLGSFDGGKCFLIKPLAGAGDTHSYLAAGSELAPFQRFETAYSQEVGHEPRLSLRLITPSECPALDLIRPGIGDAAGAPGIELASYSVARGRPLAGRVSNLGGRRLYLILVDDDGGVHRLEAKASPNGDSATFSASLVPDASSIGPLQMIMAIASERPIQALEAFSSGQLKTIAPDLIIEARRGSASAEADFFTFAH